MKNMRNTDYTKMKSRLFILVAVVFAAFSLSSCQSTKWVPDFELEIDYNTLALPANIAADGGNYYTAYIPVWSIGSWAADLTIEGEAIWCGFELEGGARPTGTHATGQGSVEKYVNYLPLYFLVNGAQEPRFAQIRFYRTDMDIERVMKVQQNGR